MRQRVLAPLVAGLLLASCATSPTGRRQLMIVSEDRAISMSREAYVAESQKLRKEGRVSRDPALRKRVDRITGRLVAQAVRLYPRTRGWEWSVLLIDDPDTVNAWCMAGGRMAIYTGLVEQLQPSDDELAQVMGHEIAHALANHSAEKISMSMATALGAAVVGAAADSAAVGAGAGAAAMLAVNLPNSRSAESEADQIGIELAARAGYDPDAAITLWQKMGRLSKGKAPPPFLSTHPSPGNRQARLAELAPVVRPLYEAPGERPHHPILEAR